MQQVQVRILKSDHVFHTVELAVFLGKSPTVGCRHPSPKPISLGEVRPFHCIFLLHCVKWVILYFLVLYLYNISFCCRGFGSFCFL